MRISNKKEDWRKAFFEYFRKSPMPTWIGSVISELKKTKVAPGLEPSMLGQEAIALPLALQPRPKFEPYFTLISLTSRLARIPAPLTVMNITE